MAKWANDAIMDAGLQVVRGAANVITVCSAQPTTYAEATSTYKLADGSLTVNSSYTLANGDTSGRKITVNGLQSMVIDSSGTATHLALCDSATSTLLYVTTITSQALTAGGTVDIPAWDIEIGDPV